MSRGVHLTGRQRRLGGAVLLALLGALCLLSPGFVERVTLYRQLNAAAGTVVDDAIGRTTVTFLTVSGIKAALALLEGSTVGVGFSLQVGDLVQPAYDFVDFVWRALLYGLLLLGLYLIVLETGFLSMGIPLAGIGLLAWAGAQGLGNRPRLAWFARRLVLWGLVLAVIVPAALLGTHHLSVRFTDPVRAAQETRIESLHDQVTQTKSFFLSLRDQFSLFSPIQSTQQMTVAIVALVHSAAESTRGAMHVFIYYVVLLLLDMLILPFLGAFVLYRTLQLLFGSPALQQATRNSGNQASTGKPGQEETT